MKKIYKVIDRFIRKGKQLIVGSSLRSLISILVVIIVLVGVIVGSLNAIELVKESKLRDEEAILYLQLEEVSRKLLQSLKDTYQDKRGYHLLNENFFISSPDYIFQKKKNGTLKAIRGQIDGLDTLKDAEKVSELRASDFNLISYRGATYLTLIASENETALVVGEVVRPGKYLLMWNFRLVNWAERHLKTDARTKMFLLNRQQQVLLDKFSSGDLETGLDRHILVQDFIKKSYQKGQLRYKDDRGSIQYGYYFSVPETNLVLFIESPEEVILGKINKVLIRQIYYQLNVVIVAFVLIQIMLIYFLRPIQSILRAFKNISEGDFEGAGQIEGIGEIRALSSAVNFTKIKLKERESSLLALAEETRRREHLSNEIEIASTIQRNFLPNDFDTKKMGISLHGIYLPAEEVAGDWYNYYYNSSSEEMYAVIADVSGHGAGSAMMTSLIAGIFFSHIDRDRKFDPREFAEAVDLAFAQIGRGHWHVTLTSLVIDMKELTCRIVNSGHVPSYLFRSSQGYVESIVLPSDYLGSRSKEITNEKVLKLEAGDFFLLYTDSLFETPIETPLYKPRMLKRFLKTGHFRHAEDVAEKVFEEFKEKTRDYIRKDDLCLFCLYMH